MDFHFFPQTHHGKERKAWLICVKSVLDKDGIGRVKPSTLTCPDCGYAWLPRKNMTRYQRQCPRCKHTHFGKAKISRNTQGASSATAATSSQPITTGLRWPQIVYDLQGISGASSPENALAKAYELIRKALPYKFKYGLESPEAVLDFLERKAADGNKRAVQAETRLHEMLEDPTLIFYETIGTDLTAPEYYEDLKKEGYEKDFLDFLSEIVEIYLKEHGIELKERNDLSTP